MMRSVKMLTVTALALTGALTAFPAFAQSPQGRNVNDGGLAAEPKGAPEYNANGQVVAAPGGDQSAGAGNCAARFHSFDPSSGTYLGRDGRRHPCS